MADSTDKPALSKRELEVLKSLAKGHSNQEIARELVISVNTVRVHLRNIFAKLEVQSRTEATMRAVQEGWVTPVTPNGDVEPAAGAKATPALAAWQKVYFGVAVIVAALVFFTPLIKPAINRPARDPFVDSNPKAVIPVPPVPNEEWAYQAQMPTARSRFALVAYNGLLYLMGGDRTSGTTGLVEVFDPATKTWQELASKPTLTANIQGAAIGGEIYVAGGCANTTQVTDRLEIFDPAGNSWRTGAPLPQPLCAYAAAVSNGQLYLIGGWNGTDYLDTVYIYNPAADAWRLADQSYPLKVGFAGAAAVKDKIYVAGGYDGQQEYAAVNALAVKTGVWDAAPSLNHPRGGLGLVAVGENLYALGGGWTTRLTANEKLAANDVHWQEIDTPFFDEWRNFGAAVIGSQIFAAGGWANEHMNAVVSYKTVYKVFIPLSY